ncbi:sulfite reductase [Methylophilales bacterium MBRSG12]|uniref:Sulfite reductase n=1 Tax=Methylophilales bacterium MBRS-H7 TaxID=1623450 RepID=A0A0H4J0J0_9PROT|nr:sulfite reductase [Methylophilales bacterium MBRSF5]AKO65293.1 sulfite reductase [Methylophilales bacterium MBRS-H7]AKO66612.1 sulfite reductase [Methylophilales bacterium MBRSG12]
MYKYDHYDRKIVNQRVDQYEDQLNRYFNKELTDEEFRPLRLQNGLYIQRHAPMLRVAIPYGLLSSNQLRTLADIADEFDRGYGHFSTRQNIQYNWPKLEDTPKILRKLADAEMHAIQTSGNCIRNITTDPYAGVTPDEIVDTRYIAEILRQWSTFHPEFALLPRKFKISISGSKHDRALVKTHDIGLELVKEQDNLCVNVFVGGGLGRTPVIGQLLKEKLPIEHLLSYCESIIRIYNLYGRRDNMYKARIKILVKALGVESFKKQVEDDWNDGKNSTNHLNDKEINRVKQFFTSPNYETVESIDLEDQFREDHNFLHWIKRNTREHIKNGYRSVTISLKGKKQTAPGDIQSSEMRVVADLADQYSFGEIRSTHEQNLVLADVKEKDLYDVYSVLCENNLGEANIGLITDIICCPGGDFCSLANAKSIPIAKSIDNLFDNYDFLFDIGTISLNISGCMNACGHHHVGNIGILGVDKDGSEWYQITLGGQQGVNASLGKVIGPSFSADEVPAVIKEILNVYVAQRDSEEELFIDCYNRIGLDPFKEAIYKS